MIPEPACIIFDWGNTIMRDLHYPGPMWDWPKVAYVDGAEAALDTLQHRYTLVIATSAGHSNTEDMIRALKRVQAHRFFTHFFSSKELGYEKPDPQFFREITKRLGMTASLLLSVGDKYPNDIRAAKACGLNTIWLNESLISGSFPDADAIISCMADLPETLLRLCSPG